MYYRLKDLREDKDLKQSEVAEIIKTSTAYYGAYELGKRDIPFERVIELAKFYDVSLDYIAERTNEKGGLRSMYLDQEEKTVIAKYEKLSRSEKNIVNDLLKILTDKKRKS